MCSDHETELRQDSANMDIHSDKRSQPVLQLRGRRMPAILQACLT